MTVGTLHALNDIVQFFFDKHGKYPATLDQAVKFAEAKPVYLEDGWGRHVLYYATDDSFVLLSLGSDAAGQGMEAPVPGGVAAGSTVDIVMINGVWAQTPDDVSRH